MIDPHRPPPDPLSFEAFRALLASLLRTDPARLAPHAYFITDLGVDSLQMVEVLLGLEELGLEVTPDDVWELHTVEDAYRFYLERAR